MKTFDELTFNAHPIAQEAEKLPEYLKVRYSKAKQAVMEFENGYGVSVVIGSMFYSDGVSTYELAVLKEGIVCYHTPIADDVLGNLSSDEVTDIMKKVQEL